jgi:hypothetical protein
MTMIVTVLDKGSCYHGHTCFKARAIKPGDNSGTGHLLVSKYFEPRSRSFLVNWRLKFFLNKLSTGFQNYHPAYLGHETSAPNYDSCLILYLI